MNNKLKEIKDFNPCEQQVANGILSLQCTNASNYTSRQSPVLEW